MMKKPDLKMPTVRISDKLSSFMRPKPVFNQPVNTERQHHISRILNGILLTAFIGLSIAVIGLKAMTLTFIEDNRDTGFAFETGEPEPTILAALPRELYTAPAKLALIAAVISIFIAVGHLVYLLIDWKTGRRTQAYSFRRNAMFVHFTHSILVLFSLVSIYITHRMTSHFREGYVMRKAANSSAFPGGANSTSITNPSNANAEGGMRYDIGTFDLETWSCELKTVKGAMMVWEDYGKQCDIEVAGRVMMIPIVITAFALAALAISQMIGSRRDPEGVRMKSEDVGLEMGKFNAV